MFKKNMTFYFFLIALWIIFFYFFIYEYDSLSTKVFLPRYRGDYISNPEYELFLGFVTYIFIQIALILFTNSKYSFIWFMKGFVVTIFLMLFYEAHYGLDAYWYAGNAIKKEVPFPFGESGTYNVMHINHIFTYIVGNSYYSLKVLNSFIGFLGLIFLYKSYEFISLKSNIEINKNFIYFFFLFPSIIFWSSILGKDSLNIFLIGMFIYSFVHLIDKFNVKYLVLVVLSIWLVSYIREWWSLIMLLSMFFYFIKIDSAKNLFLFLLITPIVILFLVSFLKSQGINSMDQIFLKMGETSQKLAYGNSKVEYHKVTTFSDYLIWFIPNLFTSLFRPMFWDVRNAFTLLAAIENMILLYFSYKYIFKKWKIIYKNRYLKFLILVIFSWSLFYVVISPTNLGMATRFKLQVLSIMLILVGISYQIYKEKRV